MFCCSWCCNALTWWNRFALLFSELNFFIAVHIFVEKGYISCFMELKSKETLYDTIVRFNPNNGCAGRTLLYKMKILQLWLHKKIYFMTFSKRLWNRTDLAKSLAHSYTSSPHYPTFWAYKLFWQIYDLNMTVGDAIMY